MKKKSKEYRPVKGLEEHIQKLVGNRYLLSCGHKLTIGHNFANNFMVYQQGGAKDGGLEIHPISSSRTAPPYRVNHTTREDKV